jgi:hypothetical protein
MYGGIIKEGIIVGRSIEGEGQQKWDSKERVKQRERNNRGEIIEEG